MSHHLWLFLLLLLLTMVGLASSIQCYTGSTLSVLECEAFSCIKQTMGIDTVRYCDGNGVSSICQTYRVYDSCENIPSIGSICCCSSDLCNSAGLPLSPVLPLLAVLVMLL